MIKLPFQPLKKTLLILMTLGFSDSGLWAQNNPAPVVVLDHYTVGSDGAAGRLTVLPDDGAPIAWKLKGKDRRRFEISEEGVLYVKKMGAEEKWWDVTVSFQKAGKRYEQELRLVRDEFVKNKVIAHRGAWKNTGAAENSLSALRHAILLGCEGSEFDVHLSADSVPVVNHNSTIGKIAIDKTPAAELLQLKLGNGEPLPSLRSYLEEGMKQNRTRLILEIKPSAMGKERSLVLTRKVVELVRQLKAQGWVDYISFDYDVLLEVLRLESYARVAYLRGEVPPERAAADKLFGLDYHFDVFRKNPSWVTEAHRLGLTVNTWTVNGAEMMDWLLQQGVDFITTDEPAMLLEKVGNNAGLKKTAP